MKIKIIAEIEPKNCRSCGFHQTLNSVSWNKCTLFNQDIMALTDGSWMTVGRCNEVSKTKEIELKNLHWSVI